MSGIYKSRLFNFLNRQKIRLSNQLGITFRHLQLATETGVKFLLYPVYLITRSNISVGQQLESESEASVNQTKISGEKIVNEDDLWWDGDTKLRSNTELIADVAEEQGAGGRESYSAKSGLSKVRQEQSGAIAQSGFFQKMWNWVKTSPVATKLNLFGEANLIESAPVTSKSVKQESGGIQVLIRRAIAYFFGDDQQQLISGNNQEALPSAQDPELGTIQLTSVDLPVVNSSRSQESKPTLFSKVSGWIEKVKTTITGSQNSAPESTEQDSSGIQALIHRAIAYFFGDDKQQLISGNNREALPSAQDPEVGTIQLTSVNLPAVKSSRSPESKLTLFSKVGSWIEKVKSNIARSQNSAPESVAHESWGIQVLIHRAIAYFFGNKQQLLSNKNLKVISSYNSDSGNDNFVATLPFSTWSLPVEEKDFSVTLPFIYWSLKLPNSNQKSNDLSVSETELTELEAASLNICSGNILSLNTTESENLSNIPLEFSSDFWEADVITVGYVKNLLERILEFLDKITWWLEKQFAKLWQFFKSLATE